MKSPSTPTTAQSLGALLKSARDIMRKDKGLNGDLDRLPMLTWIMFLKFLDDLEIQREGETKLAGKKFKPAIEPPYRWRGWAAKSDGITGDKLLAFINNEEAALPGGKKGASLFRYLRTLTSSNGDDRRDVINNLNGIRFTASDELHTLGALYESMLRAMRDAAGDSGEFYTPCAVVRFIVTVTDPRLSVRRIGLLNSLGIGSGRCGIGVSYRQMLECNKQSACKRYRRRKQHEDSPKALFPEFAPITNFVWLVHNGNRISLFHFGSLNTVSKRRDNLTKNRPRNTREQIQKHPSLSTTYAKP